MEKNLIIEYQGYITFITSLRTALKNLNRPALGGSSGACYLSITLPPYMPDFTSVRGVNTGSWNGGNYPSGIVGGDGSSSYAGGSVNPNNPSTYFAWLSIVANYCDWVNLQTYDLYGAFSSQAGTILSIPYYNGQTGTQFQAPLYNESGAYLPTSIPDNRQNFAYSVDYAVYMWTVGCLPQTSGITGAGIPSANIILGLPAYGRSYGGDWFPTQTATAPIGYDIEWTSAGAAQQTTNQPGMVSYYEIPSLISTAAAISRLNYQWASVRDIIGIPGSPTQSYIVLNYSKLQPSSNLFVYDSYADIQAKTLYAQSKNLGGVFLYALSLDNLSGGPGSYNFANSLFQNGVLQVVTTGNQTSDVNYSSRTPNN